jgi:hypothetical protein
MKVLVATSRTQGARATDFNECVDGELVWAPEPCDYGRRRGGRWARCARGFLGLSSHTGTTTALVKDLPWLTLEAYITAMRACFAAAGMRDELADGIAREHADFAATWRTGAVLERDVDDFTERRSPRDAFGRPKDV